MSFADDKFLPSGTYSIINVGYNCPVSFSEQNEYLSTSVGDYVWTISFLANKKWTIQGPSNVFLDISPDAEEGEDLASVKNPPKPHQWAIKRHSGEAHAYIIYSPSHPQLFWSLPNDNERTTPRWQLSTDRDGVASLWKFKKKELTANSPDPIEQLVAAPVQRPTQLDPSRKNLLAITIPPGWLTTISSVSCGNCINLIRVRRVVNGALEKQDLISGWDAVDKAMTIDGSDSDSLALPSTEDAYVLVVEAFHSKNRVRKDPRKLPGFKDLSTNLRVITTSRASYMKGFPDFQTFTIFDESLDGSGAGRAQNAIITIHASLKVAVDLNDPGKPEADTVNKGYNDDLDRPRPSDMDQWLEKYHAVFVVDDSSAMAVDRAWGKAQDAVLQVATEAMQYDTNGIDIYFLNSLLYRDAITTPEEVVRTFSEVKLQGPSPIGARLQFVLNKIINQLEEAKDNTADYGHIKPFNIVVLTNSPPSDNPTRVIRSASRTLNKGLHHPNAVSIQFVQVGNDNRVKTALKKLSDDPSFSIADTVSFGAKFTPENLQKAVLGAMHPSVRAKVASSSGSQLLYYRVYNKESAIPTKRPAYLNNTYIGRIKSKWVAPPHNAGSIRLCLSSMENIDPSKTRLFTTSSSSGKAPLADDIPVSLKNNQTLGLIPEEPLALTFLDAIPKDGMKPGTESLRIPPEAQSPVIPRFLYYGIYNEGGASASKAPVDPEEPWVSKVDLDLIPPPLSVTSLMSFISAMEGITCSSQLFVDKDTMSPLNDDHILTEEGNWPGSTTEGHVMFKLIADTNECKGFPSGKFHIRSVGTNHYWTCHWLETHQEGNTLCIWTLYGSEHPSQVFFVNSLGNLCCHGSNGKALDVMDNSIMLTHDRERTEPWPNPWSHPLPTFSYSEESKIITVKTHADPLVANHWPRPESEWKGKDFAVAARSVVATKNRSFQEIVRWAPHSAQHGTQWTSRVGHGSPANSWHNLGVEEKGKNMRLEDLNRMKWEFVIL